MDRQIRCARRRRGLEHDFRRLEERRSVLHEKLERAQEDRATAKAALASAETALARASALYAGVEQDCVELRHLIAADPDAVNGLPFELLSAIFATVASEPDSLWPNIEHAKYNAARAMLPYRLGAVCRHWRSVVLSSGPLWTYVALPSMPVESFMRRRSILLDHVAFRLERSRSLAIDVCIDFPKYLTEDSLSFWRDTLTLVVQHAWRWRRVKFRVPFSNSTFEQLMSGRSLPLLQELGLHCSVESGVMDVSWVFHAPSLRTLSSPDIQFRLATATGTSTITSASFCVFSGCLDALEKMPLLENLSLDFTGVSDLGTAPDGPLTLPALKSLKLRGGRNVIDHVLFLSFTGPQVTRVNLSGDDFAVTLEDEARNFARAFPNVVDLELDGERQFPHASLPDLRHFSHIKTITLIGWSIPRWFFDSMDFADPGAEPHRVRMCPELESLAIRCRPGETYEVLLPDLAFFLRDRAAVCRARGKQFTVAFDGWPSDALLPSWFRQALAFTLGAANVRLTTADGLRYDASGGLDGQSEDEAQFTDSETTDSSSESHVSDEEFEGPELEAGSGGIWANGSQWDTDSEDMDYVDTDD